MKNVLIYLVSQSPRRRELLHQVGIEHEVILADIDETPHVSEAAELYVSRMALEKARAGRASLSVIDKPLLAADTSVVVDGQILGKPRDEMDARAMLQQLAGRTHQVISAVALVDEAVEASRLSVSHVSFRDINDEESRAYWCSGEPADKAGGYGIQGLGALFIERLEGSYSGVMGLPLFETAALMRDFGVQLPILGVEAHE
ncbi:Septum formation protein Maf [hydrothermal vent metagenome]|uniref:Septum formation protein Maf n=1 Tax=hydrothermal vent metagenome TaxID=652676 RepID=A0A3B1A5V3_9ZZZZ